MRYLNRGLERLERDLERLEEKHLIELGKTVFENEEFGCAFLQQHIQPILDFIVEEKDLSLTKPIGKVVLKMDSVIKGHKNILPLFDTSIRTITEICLWNF